ncbi:MAG: asparagine synthase (glutamine-hydrolyzing), partial [Candidatus Scalindua sp.]
NTYNQESVLTAMRDSLTHGGPDDAGIYLEKTKAIGLAHRRLSIIDLSAAGHQPMCSEDGNLVITYNGEVYNFQEIKNELLKKGYVFRSNSDTEVVLKSYQEWGLEAVTRFRGMFAFALWDRKKEELILLRDRVGIKPLYWYYNNGLFLFASELKSFHHHPGFKRNIDKKALATYLSFGYIPAPNSIFTDTFKLKPGHMLVINKAGNIKIEEYWNVDTYYLESDKIGGGKYQNRYSEEEVVEELEEILKESFKYRMIADVPVGVFLSGGIDSSLVAAILAKEGYKLKTFTIGFYEKKYNEAEYAKEIAQYLGTEHTELYCTVKEAFKVILKLPELYDEPFGDSSAIPTHLVSMLAKQKVKVSLSADGGDELFCGYNSYELVGERVQKLKRTVGVGLLKKLMNAVSAETANNIYKHFQVFLPGYDNFADKYSKIKSILKAKTVLEEFITASSYFLPENLKLLGLPEIYSQNDQRNTLNRFHQMMLFDFHNYLPEDILTKVDRASMGVALEAREPLLDHKIVEYAARLPIGYKYRNKTRKWIIKKILNKYIPESLFDRPKKGFSVPIHNWFKDDLKELMIDYLSPERIKREGIFNSEAVTSLKNGYFNNDGVSVRKLWFLLMFEMWQDRWIN